MATTKRYYVMLPGRYSNVRKNAATLKELRRIVYEWVNTSPAPYTTLYMLMATTGKTVGKGRVEHEDVGRFLITKKKEIYYESWKKPIYGLVKSDGSLDIKNKWPKL